MLDSRLRGNRKVYARLIGLLRSNAVPPPLEDLQSHISGVHIQRKTNPLTQSPATAHLDSSPAGIVTLKSF
jgi:hypothetical protein